MSSADPNTIAYFNTRFLKACELHQQEHYKEAETIYHSLITAHPDAWILRYNLGILYFDQNRFDAALSEYTAAYNLTKPNNDLLYNLAICQKQCGQIEQAIDTYLQALDLEPYDIDSLYNLAGCYRVIEHFEEAINFYHQVLLHDPSHQSALNNLAYLYHKSGDKKNAITYYSELLKINQGHQAAEYMIAALSGKRKKYAPASYIRDVFDEYSEHYEDSLINKLKYHVPEKLFEFVNATSGTSQFGSILDLGCGTGLSGVSFRNYCKRIDGIDLSEKMVSVAAGKNIYDNLFIGDIHHFLTDLSVNSYDLIIAADVFSYIGDLQAIFSRAHDAVIKSGHFYFSVEKSDSDSSPYQLQESGRFVHCQDYILRTAKDSGWQLIDLLATNLRKENETWVSGMFYGFKAV